MPDARPWATLVVAIGQGNRAAFRELYDEAGPRIRGWVARTTPDAARVEDVVQDVMLRVWRHAPTFDPTRSSGEAWIWTVARNAKIDRLRRDAQPWLLFDDSPQDLAGTDLRDAFSVADAAHVRTAVEGLPVDQRRTIERAWFEGQPLPTIAESEGVPLGTVKSRLRLGLARLRDHFAGSAT